MYLKTFFEIFLNSDVFAHVHVQAYSESNGVRR